MYSVVIEVNFGFLFHRFSNLRTINQGMSENISIIYKYELKDKIEGARARDFTLHVHISIRNIPITQKTPVPSATY